MTLARYIKNKIPGVKNPEDELQFKCPFCHDHKPRLYVNIDRSSPKYGLWICHNCDRKGNALSLIQKLENLSYYDAKNRLYEIDNNINILYDSDSDDADDSLSDNDVLLSYLISKDNNETDDDSGGLSVKQPAMLPFGLRYFRDNLNNPEALPFIQYCTKRKFPMDYLVNSGAGYIKYGNAKTSKGQFSMYNQVVFMTYDMNNNYAYWNTRSIYPSKVKTYNAPEIEGHYGKSDLLFNLNNAIKYKNIVLCEGVPDALTIGLNGICSFGKMVSDRQKELLAKYLNPGQNLFVMLDMDASKIALETAKSLYSVHPNTFIVYNPYYRDQNSLGRQKTWEVIKNNSIRANTRGLMNFALKAKS